MAFLVLLVRFVVKLFPLMNFIEKSLVLSYQLLYA